MLSQRTNTCDFVVEPRRNWQPVATDKRSPLQVYEAGLLKYFAVMLTYGNVAVNIQSRGPRHVGHPNLRVSTSDLL
jgi:hypothetical protein